MTDLNLAGKRLLIRQDLNVPIKAGNIVENTRIRAALPTIKMAIAAEAKVMIMSHLGRPTAGIYEQQYSLAPVADCLTTLLKQPVHLEQNWLEADQTTIPDGEVVLCENVRFHIGEIINDDALSQQMAALCDVFVMDAFGTAHRVHASTYGIAKYAPMVCAGPLLSAELEALGGALDSPARPVVAIVGGAKVSTKLALLDTLSHVVDNLIVGGGIANTFIAAEGNSVGCSLYEPDLIATCKALTKYAHGRGSVIPVPIDVVCGKAFAKDAEATVKAVTAIEDDDMIFDVGPESIDQLTDIIKGAGTIIWNGPIGVFEFTQFEQGTKAIASAIARSDAFSIAGGGDTLAAISQYKVCDNISYISTGGGAFLAFLEGKPLPAVAVLERCTDC